MKTRNEYISLIAEFNSEASAADEHGDYELASRYRDEVTQLELELKWVD